MPNVIYCIVRGEKSKYIKQGGRPRRFGVGRRPKYHERRTIQQTSHAASHGEGCLRARHEFVSWSKRSLHQPHREPQDDAFHASLYEYLRVSWNLTERLFYHRQWCRAEQRSSQCLSEAFRNAARPSKTHHRHHQRSCTIKRLIVLTFHN